MIGYIVTDISMGTKGLGEVVVDAVKLVICSAVAQTVDAGVAHQFLMQLLEALAVHLHRPRGRMCNGPRVCALLPVCARSLLHTTHRTLAFVSYSFINIRR